MFLHTPHKLLTMLHPMKLLHLPNETQMENLQNFQCIPKHFRCSPFSQMKSYEHFVCTSKTNNNFNVLKYEKNNTISEASHKINFVGIRGNHICENNEVVCSARKIRMAYLELAQL